MTTVNFKPFGGTRRPVTPARLVVALALGFAAASAGAVVLGALVGWLTKLALLGFNFTF